MIGLNQSLKSLERWALQTLVYLKSVIEQLIMYVELTALIECRGKSQGTEIMVALIDEKVFKCIWFAMSFKHVRNIVST